MEFPTWTSKVLRRIAHIPFALNGKITAMIVGTLEVQVDAFCGCDGLSIFLSFREQELVEISFCCVKSKPWECGQQKAWYCMEVACAKHEAP